MYAVIVILMKSHVMWGKTYSRRRPRAYTVVASGSETGGNTAAESETNTIQDINSVVS